mgnify:CR=1 FL=1
MVVHSCGLGHGTYPDDHLLQDRKMENQGGGKTGGGHRRRVESNGEFQSRIIYHGGELFTTEKNVLPRRREEAKGVLPDGKEIA